ncbi:unnamed protein product [Closterium sp. NIES-53]
MLPCCYSMRNFESRATSHGLGSLPRPIQVATALRHPATSAIQPAPTSLRSSNPTQSPSPCTARSPTLRFPNSPIPGQKLQSPRTRSPHSLLQRSSNRTPCSPRIPVTSTPLASPVAPPYPSPATPQLDSSAPSPSAISIALPFFHPLPLTLHLLQDQRLRERADRSSDFFPPETMAAIEATPMLQSLRLDAALAASSRTTVPASSFVRPQISLRSSRALSGRRVVAAERSAVAARVQAVAELFPSVEGAEDAGEAEEADVAPVKAKTGKKALVFKRDQVRGGIDFSVRVSCSCLIISRVSQNARLL